MNLIVGLGNPGLKYAKTRHNLGFRVVKRITIKLDLKMSQRGFSSRYTEMRYLDDKLMLMMPQTFMNRSGLAVRQAVDYFGIDMDEVIVVHDDLDLEFGRLKIKKGGGTGGHNGLASIVEHVHANDFIRVRLGIGRPKGRQEPSNYVLSRFDSQEAKEVDVFVAEAANAVLFLLEHGLDAAMQKYNT